MPHTIIFLGLVLCGQTVAALFLSTDKYPVEFLPLMLGVLALFGGIVSLNPHRRFYTGWALGLAAAFVGILAGARLGLMVSKTAADSPVGEVIGWVAFGLLVVCAALIAACWAMVRTSKNRGRRSVLSGVGAGVDNAMHTSALVDPSVLPVVLASDESSVPAGDLTANRTAAN